MSKHIFIWFHMIIENNNCWFSALLFFSLHFRSITNKLGLSVGMFKAEDFISQKPSIKFQHYTSESHINTIEILYILESHIANSLCWPLIFKNAIIRADSLSLPCSASFSHDSLRCTLMNINTAACQSTTFDWQTLRGLINIHEQFLNVRAQPVLGVKHGALIAERVSENYYIDGAFLRGLSAQQSLFVLSE